MDQKVNIFGSDRWVESRLYNRLYVSRVVEARNVRMVLLDALYNKGRGAWAVISKENIYLIDCISGSCINKRSLTVESILDVKRKELANDVWNAVGENEYVIKPEIKNAIQASLNGFLDTINPELKSKINTIWIIGSMTSHYYTDSSDIDINVFGDFTEDDLNAILVKDPANRSELLGKRPVNFYFRTTEEIGVPEHKSVYDLTNEKWLKFVPDKDFVINDEVIQQAISWCRKLDLDVGELRRDIIEYRTYTESIFNIKYLDIGPEDLNQKLAQKLGEIKSDIDILNTTYKSILHIRKGAFQKQSATGDNQIQNPDTDPNWSTNNIIYKALERFGYIRLLHKVFMMTKDKEFNAETDLDPLIDILGG